MKKLLLPLTILLFFGLVVSSCSSDDVLQRENNEQPNIVKRNNEKAREAGIRLLESFGSRAEIRDLGTTIRRNLSSHLYTRQLFLYGAE